MSGIDELDRRGAHHPGPPAPGLPGEHGAVARPPGDAGDRLDGDPPWPFWLGLAGMLVAATVLILFVGPISLVARELLGRSPELTIAETVLSDAVLVGCAVGLAAAFARPRASHFGLRATALWPAVGFCALGIGAYLAFGGLYEAIYPQEVKQTTLETLGADRGTFGLVAVGVLVVVLAPVTEELFFRGFLYRSLRARLPVLAAVLAAGVPFGLVHWSTGVAATLPLTVLGVAFCLIVERTGSIYPVIALHSVVNAMAYTFSSDAPEGSAVVAPSLLAAVLAACLLLPWLARGREVRRSVETAAATG